MDIDDDTTEETDKNPEFCKVCTIYFGKAGRNFY